MVGFNMLVVCDIVSSGEYVGNYVLEEKGKSWMDSLRLQQKWWNIELDI